MKAMLTLAFAFLPWAGLATPIQILSGTITVPVSFNVLVPLTVNLTTSTGSITSAGGLDSSQPWYESALALPVTFTPNFGGCCGGTAQISDNGSSYSFLGNNPGDTIIYLDQGGIYISTP